MVHYASPVCRQAGFQVYKNMICVYVLFDHFTEEMYIGMTNDLTRRIKEHKRGQSKYTKKFKEIEIFYVEKFDNYKIARKREKFLKSGCGREFLRLQLKYAGIL